MPAGTTGHHRDRVQVSCDTGCPGGVLSSKRLCRSSCWQKRARDCCINGALCSQSRNQVQ